MKKLIQYTIILLLIAAVGYSGSGINYMIYCCNTCQEDGVETVLDNKCCETHSHVHTAVSDQIQSVIEHKDHHSVCAMERVSFDWYAAVAFLVSLQPSVINLNFFSNYFISFSFGLFAQQTEYTAFSGPPLVSPRQYLTLLTVLLI